MKAKLNIKEEYPNFKPMTLTINIETAQELQSLWHRFNINSISTVFTQKNTCKGGLVKYKNDPNVMNFAHRSDEVFKLLDDACVALDCK